jgi:small subunit ribosomal protein S7
MFRPGEQPPPPSPSQEQDVQMRDLTANEVAINQLQQAAFGLKFEEPPMPMDKLEHAKYHMKYRYDEGITQITRLLMRDGKLGKAQNVRCSLTNIPFCRDQLSVAIYR